MTRLLCRIGRTNGSGSGPRMGSRSRLGQAIEGCRHCDAVRERPWAGGSGIRNAGGDMGGAGSGGFG